VTTDRDPELPKEDAPPGGLPTRFSPAFVRMARIGLSLGVVGLIAWVAFIVALRAGLL
jgi:hypothetical protein